MIHRADFVDNEIFYDEHGEWMLSADVLVLLQRSLNSLRWIIMDMKHKHDETFFQVGDYSPELKEAMELLNTIEREMSQ